MSDSHLHPKTLNVYAGDSTYGMALARAQADVAQYGDSLETMIFADYVDEDGIATTRPFQWARHESRQEFARFMSWCIKNNRFVRVTPFALYR